jgi:uncharacterized membrane protein YjfL (UPF0719 family)
MMIFDINVIHTMTRLVSAAGWALFGVVLLYFGLRLYDRLDPIDYRSEIERGNVAAAVQLAAVALALAAIVVTAIVT